MKAALDLIPLLSLAAAGLALLGRPKPPPAEPALDLPALVTLVQLYADGNLTESEFSAGKSKLLGGSAVAQGGSTSDNVQATHMWEEVAKHDTPADCWAVVVNEVYDFSCFFAAEPCYDHPGGDKAISKWCGGDATEGFLNAGHKPGIADRKGVGHIVIGTVPPKPADSGAASSAGTVPSFMDLEPWRCQEDECKWLGYHKDPRSWQKVIGTHTWFFIHSVAAKYPDHPSAADQRHMINFIAFLGQLYPCKVCRLNLQQELRYPEVTDSDDGEYYGIEEAVTSRQKLAIWLCRLHNIVNRDTGKELHECTNIGMDMQYLRNCGECSVKKDADGNDDHQGHTNYVWDADLYAAGALQPVKSATDQFGATELEEALQLAVIMGYEDAASAKKLRQQVANGELTYDQALNQLEDQMADALAIRDSNKKRAAAAKAAAAKDAAPVAAVDKSAEGIEEDEEDWDM